MKRILILVFVLQLFTLNGFTFSGRILTPYFKAIGYYDYIIKGKVIAKIEDYSYHVKVEALKIEIIDKMGNDLKDTIWIMPIISEGLYPCLNYGNLTGQYYFAIKIKENNYNYNPSDPYFALGIENNCVTNQFTSFDIFLSRILPFHYHRKMKIEKFERKIKRKLNAK